MFDTESNPNREGCLPGDCWQVELTETKKRFSTESPNETSSSDLGLWTMKGNPVVRSTQQIRPVFVTLWTFIISLPFNRKKKKKRTRFLVMLIDGALIQVIQLYQFVILWVWFNTGKSFFETRFAKFKTSLPPAPAKPFKLAAFLSFSRIRFHHCWDSGCCPVSGSSKVSHHVLPGQSPVNAMFPVLGKN